MMKKILLMPLLLSCAMLLLCACGGKEKAPELSSPSVKFVYDGKEFANNATINISASVVDSNIGEMYEVIPKVKVVASEAGSFVIQAKMASPVLAQWCIGGGCVMISSDGTLSGDGVTQCEKENVKLEKDQPEDLAFHLLLKKSDVSLPYENTITFVVKQKSGKVIYTASVHLTAVAK